MKVASAARQVETFGLQEPTSFQIKATAKAFEILSSGLYKDKVTAILREISANATDAHTDAGIPERPISVHLPSTLSPYLSIRDYGKGLTPERMFKVYQTYFASLKEDSNDYIGGLGLGSKSPFSYVDAYSSVSRTADGRKITYDLFKGESGEPNIAIRSEDVLEEGEETGLEVIVPVTSAGDVNEFVNKAKAVFEHYPVKPIFTGARFEGVNSYKAILSGKGWRLLDRKVGHYYANAARAIMGIIAYPVSATDLIHAGGFMGKDHETLTPLYEAGVLDRNASATDLSQRIGLFQRILASPFDFDFGIGDLDITAGREELSYDKATKLALLTRVAEVAAELHSNIQKRFEKCKTRLEAKTLYGEIFERDSPTERLFGRQYRIRFKGEDITGSTFAINLDEYISDDTRMILYCTSQRGSPRYTQTYRPTDRMSGGESVFRFTPKGEINHYGNEVARGMPVFFYDDLKGTGYHSARIFAYRDEHPDQRVLLFQPGDAADLEQFIRYLDGIEVRPVSELPKPAYEARNRTKARLRRLIDRGDLEARSFNSMDGGPWGSAEVSLEDGGIFVLTNRGEVIRQQGDEHSYSPSDQMYFRDVYLMAKALGLIRSDEEVIAVPLSISSQFRTVKKYEGKWINFFDLIRERAESLLSDEIMDRVAENDKCNAFALPFADFNNLMQDLVSKLEADHDIATFFNRYEASKADKVAAHYAVMARYLGKSKPADIVAYNREWTGIISRYPMMELAVDGYFRATPQSMKKIVDYIGLMDQNA